MLNPGAIGQLFDQAMGCLPRPPLRAMHGLLEWFRFTAEQSMRRTLLIIWGLIFFLAMGCLFLIAQGLIRDFYTGDPVAGIDPQISSDWTAVPFRLWGKGSYDLQISSVNHEPSSVGRLFRGEMQVRVKDPHERVVFERTYNAGVINHRVPNNYSDNQLASMVLDDWPLRQWRLEVRVTEGDPNFVTTGKTEVRLRKQRYDPGMGGLMNYAMMLPGGVLLLIALFISVFLARGGSRWPLVATATSCIAFLVLLIA
jgi:hypothetical protein